MPSHLRFYFLVRSWNSFEYFDTCIDSLLLQQGIFTILFVDDCSDYTRSQKQHIKSKLKSHIVIFNQERKFSLRNAYELVHTYVSDKNAIIINVDGDDWLIRNDVLPILQKEYSTKDILLTYGDCRYYAPGTQIHMKIASEHNHSVNTRYSKETEQTNSYRRQYFFPLHLRTWKVGAFKKIQKTDFLRTDGTWIKFCEDQAIFLPLLEMSGGKYEVINTPIYCYNSASEKNDSKMNHLERMYDEVTILRKKPYEKV